MSKDIYLCTKEDDFIREKLRWVVTLSDGRTVFQDDGRPGVKPSSAWRRLRRVCQQESLGIEKMILQFRSHKVQIPEGYDGYYFVQAAGALVGHDTVGFYLVGCLSHNIIKVTKYKVPEILPVGQEFRLPNPKDESLIIHYGKEKNK